MTVQSPTQYAVSDQEFVDFRACNPVGSLGAVLIIPLVPAPVPAGLRANPWSPGVLQIVLPPRDDLSDRTTDSTTNRRARSADMAAGPDALLHRLGGENPTEGRWHFIPKEVVQFDVFNMFAAEFVSGETRSPDGSARNGVLVVHLSEISHQGNVSREERTLKTLDALRGLDFWTPEIPEQQRTDLCRKFFSYIEAIMPAGWHLPSRRCRIPSLTHMPELEDHQQPLSDEVLYSIISGNDLRKKRPSAQRLNSLDFVEKSGGWRCLVMRDGMACTIPSDADAELIRIYFHSIFMDPMLLARLQIDGVTLLQSDFLVQDMSKVEPLLALELAVFDFRRKVWSDHLSSKKTSPRDELLRTFQKQYELNSEVQALTEDVIDSSRLVSTIQARDLRESQERTQQLIQYLTALFVPPGLTYTAAAVLSDPSPASFIASTITGVVLTAASSLGVWAVHNRKHRHT